MRHLRKPGVTLTELLIGSSLILMLLALFTLVFVMSHRRFQLINSVCDVQNSAIMGMDRLAGDLAESDSSRIRIRQDSETSLQSLYFPTARHEDGSFILTADYQPDFSAWLLYHLYPEQKTDSNERRYYLVRRHLILPSSDEPAAAFIDGETRKLDTQSRIVARNVSSFVIAPGNTALQKVTLEARRTFRGRPITFRVEKTVYVEYGP